MSTFPEPDQPPAESLSEQSSEQLSSSLASPISEPASGLRPPLQSLQPFTDPIPWLRAFWKFSRPHTVIGTSLSVTALCAIALASVPQEFPPVSSATSVLTVLGQWFLAWIACLCGNVYIVGLNQVEDIAIDRINKPDLPIASGEFTKRHGQTIVWLMGIGAIALSLISQNIYLILTIVLSLIIGTAYSLPPVRLKRFPFWPRYAFWSCAAQL